MNCSDAEQLFDAYLDGELGGSLRLEFDAHRLRCQTCQRKLALLEACEAVLSSAHREPDLSADFTDRVMAEITARASQRPRRLNRPLRVAAAMLPLAAAVGLFAVLRPSAEPQPSRPTEVLGEAVVQTPLDRAMQDPTGVELYTYIVKQLWAARANLARDMNELRSYALNLTLPQMQEDRPLLGPLDLLNGLLPGAAPTDETPPAASEEFSL